MTVYDTGISWTDSTWNPTVGCTKASAGCDHCYAKAMVDRLWGGDFETVKLRPERFGDLTRLGRPMPTAEGGWRPRLVFVNSMSDLMHEQIPDWFRHQVFDRMEAQKGAVFQVLTKRAMTMFRIVEERYGSGKKVPENIWFGVSVEDNRVKGRIDILRRIKERVDGKATLFLSVEPVIGPVDKHAYDGMDQVLIGGESRQAGKVTYCEPEWVGQSLALADRAGAPIWFKQWGEWPNNPLYREARAFHVKHYDRVRWAIEHGEKLATITTDPKTGKPRVEGEKGGATFEGRTFRQWPKIYAGSILAPKTML